MVKESLSEYVSRLLNSGYDPTVIRNTLINAGHAPYEVDRAIRYAQAQPTGRKSISLSVKTVVIAISAAIIILLLVIGGIKLFSSEPKTIELTMLPTKTELYQGDKLNFLNEYSSEQSRSVNAFTNFEVIEKRTNQPVASKQEKVDVGRRRSTTTEILIPMSATPGGYTLRATITYEGKSVQKSFSFTLLERPVAEPGKPVEDVLEEEMIGECPVTCDDYNKCTNDFCDKGICRHKSVSPCCGNGVCESGENKLNCIDDCIERTGTPEDITAQARQVSKTDQESAAVLCSSIVRVPFADECFSQIALSSSSNQLCENVQDFESKDRCYMSFALEGDFSVCPKINNNYMSKACNSLLRTQTLAAQAEQIAKEEGYELQSA